MNKKRYDAVIDECRKLVIDRNKAYGDTVDVIDIHTIIGLCIMKLTRIYKLGNNSKALDELQDVINYCVFAIERLKKEKKIE